VGRRGQWPRIRSVIPSALHHAPRGLRRLSASRCTRTQSYRRTHNHIPVNACYASVQFLAFLITCLLNYSHCCLVCNVCIALSSRRLYSSSSSLSSSFDLSEKHEISSKSLTMRTGQPGIKACTYSVTGYLK